ncbi:DUF362 domain-containing protein [Synechocystis sp. LKSZ1]|uniref:DUF362 domain-containing protein n=1 Tax=Synechocystis sp. LKSZ1 TaxID=3144951 RepID=UPI00336BB153
MIPISLLSTASYDLESLSLALERLLAPWGGITTWVKPGSRVLLKPNLLTAGRPGQECITRPELVYCVAKLVQAAGGRPFLGDSPAFGTARGVVESNGYLPLIQELNLPVVEFHGHRYGTESQAFHHLRLSKEAMEADVVINLPKIKSHVQLTMTLGVKNLFGCVPGKMKAWWHMEAGKDATRFGEMLVETARAIQPDLTIVDGIIAHEGNGPMNGSPRPLGLLAAATNVFALDAVLADILQVDPALIPTLVAQERLGLTPAWKDLTFPLAHPSSLQVQDWKLPEALLPIDFGLPRVLRSTFKHLYIRFIKEPFHAYAQRPVS